MEQLENLGSITQHPEESTIPGNRGDNRGTVLVTPSGVVH